MKKVGIYSITNTQNNRVYIGSSIDIETRWRVHRYRLRNNKHTNAYLQADWNKCGEGVFEFEILEICFMDQIVSLEQKFLNENFDYQNLCYNMRELAETNFGYKHSKETRAKMSKARKGKTPSRKTIEKSIEKLKGKTWEEIHGKDKSKKMKENLSSKTRKRLKPTSKRNQISANTKEVWERKGFREKMKKIHKERLKHTKHPGSKKIAQYNLNGEIIEVFDNAVEAAKVTGFNANNMRQVATGVKKTHMGFVWRYV